MYYSFVCSDSSDDDTAQAACAVGHIHEWIDDITACPWYDDAGCTITVPTGPDAFISDLLIEDAFGYMDADDDGSLDSDEQAWFALRNAVAKWAFASPGSDLMSECDVDDSTDPLVTDFSGDLDKDELYDCWVAQVPECLTGDFDTDFADLWTNILGLGDDDTIDATGVDALEAVIAEVSDWHTSSTSGHNHEACPDTTRRLFSFFSSFFN